MNLLLINNLFLISSSNNLYSVLKKQLYNVHIKLYTVQYTVYTVQCIVYRVLTIYRQYLSYTLYISIYDIVILYEAAIQCVFFLAVQFLRSLSMFQEKSCRLSYLELDVSIATYDFWYRVRFNSFLRSIAISKYTVYAV